MKIGSLGTLIVVALTAVPVCATAKCDVRQYAQLPVTLSGSQPTITGTINGHPARFLADSGAFHSMITLDSARKFGLKPGPAPKRPVTRGTGGPVRAGLLISGIGGSQYAQVTTVKELTLEGFLGGGVIKNAAFMVADTELGGEIVGLMGQNLLGHADTEFDLANGVIRLFQAKDCDDVIPAYWAEGLVVGEIALRSRTPATPHLIGNATLNGQTIRVLFDSGAGRSILTRRAAARVGITPESEGVVATDSARGIGRRTAESWIARFDSLDLGGELIKNARLRFGDVQLADCDMLLGLDFFLSHRIYISADQSKLFFTYNGGPVFDLRESAEDQGPRVAPLAEREVPAGPPSGSSTSKD